MMQKMFFMSKSKINKQYLYNKEANVGTYLTCPICGISFVKKQYSQAFCCKECKNKFWNKKEPEKPTLKYYAHTQYIPLLYLWNFRQERRNYKI